ncbi:MAG: NAD(+) synthase [Dysgonamonadaceae bacterium]|jgi:NAD+ synthase (glutamine-hydrolysing)|nr:NAD(+) synthase [Dysgonamonadaceae bacterium]
MDKSQNHHGFVRVAAAIPEVKVADSAFNAQEIIKLIRDAAECQVQIVCFPELCITAYTCGDLFHQQFLQDEAENALQQILSETKTLPVIGIVGLPVRCGNQLFDVAAVFQSGKILGVVPKSFLPNYSEFYEKRWFAAAGDTTVDSISLCGQQALFGTKILFGNTGFLFAVEICEDLWATIPPSSQHALNGAHIIFNLSASNELIAKNDYRQALIAQQSARCFAGYVYASSGWGESTTDLVFSGNASIAENGVILSEGERFCFNEQLIVNEIDIERLVSDRQRKMHGKAESNTYRTVTTCSPEVDRFSLTRSIDPHPFIPKDKQYAERCEEIFSIQTGGLAKRLLHTKARALVVGISGGLDSTLALLVCVKTCDKLHLDRKQIIGVTMPGFGTTKRTYNNAVQLIQSLGVTLREIDIKPACEQHFKDIGHDASVHDVVYENTQARERTQLLMDIANQQQGLVIGTGDLSELALGWATYNGDHISMYGVNSSIPKTLVRHLVRWVAQTQVDKQSEEILLDIIRTPVSPELLPANEQGQIAQKTEDLVGPYELHDFFLYYMIRFGFRPEKIFFLAQHAFNGTYDEETIRKWMDVFYRRFFSQQFKRSCMPDGPKVGSINLSPRGDWRMPSDTSVLFNFKSYKR